MTEATSRKQRAWAAIVGATVVNLPSGSLYAFSLFLSPMESLLGATRSELSFVFGIATIGTTLGMNIAPRLFALAPAWVLVAGAALFGAIGVTLASTATSLVQLAIGYGVLFGVGGGCNYILVQQGVNLMISRFRGLANGYMVGLYPAGAMVAAPLFAWGLERWGVRMTLAGLAGSVLLSGVIAAVLVLWAGMRLPLPAPKATPSAGAPERRTRVFWQLWFVFFLAAAAGLTVLSQAAGIVKSYGGSLAIAVLATTSITGAVAVARLGGGGLVDIFAIPTVMAMAHLLSLIGAIMLSVWTDPVVAAVTLAMIGMGYGLISGSTAGAISMYWASHDYGRVAGRIYIAWCVAAVSLPVLAGHLFDLTGGYAATVIIAGCGNVAGIVLALTLPRQTRSPVIA